MINKKLLLFMLNIALTFSLGGMLGKRKHAPDRQAHKRVKISADDSADIVIEQIIHAIYTLLPQRISCLVPVNLYITSITTTKEDAIIKKLRTLNNGKLPLTILPPKKLEKNSPERTHCIHGIEYDVAYAFLKTAQMQQLSKEVADIVIDYIQSQNIHSLSLQNIAGTLLDYAGYYNLTEPMQAGIIECARKLRELSDKA